MGKYFPELPPQAKCSRCRERARIGLPSHNARFCPDCYLHFFTTAVRRALKHMRIPRTEPLMIAISGGKDSLTVWDVLQDLGYHTRGLHINLGVGRFSEAAREAIQDFAQSRGLAWTEYDLKEEFGYYLPQVQKRFRSKVCSVCGRLKRQFLNRLAVREGYSSVVTGHNLDDEAGRLLGNLVGNRQHYVKKHSPYLPSPHPAIPAKIKPLYRVEIREILIYAELKDIRFAQEQCPYSKGATSHYFKEAMDLLEKRMPGTKRQFLFAYADARKGREQEAGREFGSCRYCGQPAYADICGVCSLGAQIAG